MLTKIIYLIAGLILISTGIIMEEYTKKKFPELFEEDEENS